MAASTPIGGALTVVQEDVLQWIADGCPEGVYEGYSARITARALQRRGLVRIRGHGPSWQARLTDEGQRRLDGETQRDVTPRRVGTPTTRTKPRRERQQTKTEKLVADLIAADGVLRLPIRFSPGGPTVRQRAYAAEAQGRLPEGKTITTRVVGDEIELRLVDGERGPENDIDADRIPVTVPSTVPRLDPIAKRWRKLKAHHEVSERLLDRTELIVHAIATEAKRRRWKIRIPHHDSASSMFDRWAPARDGHLALSVKDVEFSVRLKETGVKARGKWERNVKSAARSTFWDLLHEEPKPTGPYDAGATGVLTVTLSGGDRWLRAQRFSSFGDRKNTPAEDRLSDLFREIEIRLQETILAREEAQREKERREEAARLRQKEHERCWEIEMDKARVRFAERYRADELRRQAETWQESQALTAYCDALEAAHQDENTLAWIAWSRAFITQLDPLQTAKQLPEPPEPTAEDLKTFLPQGWSPYGPNRGFW